MEAGGSGLSPGFGGFAAGLDGAGNLIAWTHRVVGTPIRIKFGPLPKGLDGSLVDEAPVVTGRVERQLLSI